MDQGIALGEDGFWLTDDGLSGDWIFGAAFEGIVRARQRPFNLSHITRKAEVMHRLAVVQSRLGIVAHHLDPCLTSAGGQLCRKLTGNHLAFERLKAGGDSGRLGKTIVLGLSNVKGNHVATSGNFFIHFWRVMHL